MNINTATDGAIRDAEWGHWGIIFSTRHNRHDYAPASIKGALYFPVSNAGPCDLPKRAEYVAAIKAWRENGELPAGLAKVGL
jgi:hypothetical protein